MSNKHVMEGLICDKCQDNMDCKSLHCVDNAFRDYKPKSNGEKIELKKCIDCAYDELYQKGNDIHCKDCSDDKGVEHKNYKPKEQNKQDTEDWKSNYDKFRALENDVIKYLGEGVGIVRQLSETSSEQHHDLKIKANEFYRKAYKSFDELEKMFLGTVRDNMLNEAEYGCKIMELLAQSYCSKENEKKVLDNDLIVEMTARLLPFIKTLISERKKSLKLKLYGQLFVGDIETLQKCVEIMVKDQCKQAVLSYDNAVFPSENMQFIYQEDELKSIKGRRKEALKKYK